MERSPFCLNWGILGAGNVANDFCIAHKSLSQEEHKIRAVASRSRERAEKLAKTYNIGKAYGSYEELVQDEDIHIIYIGTVNPAHKSACLLALNNGKHVLCEKPLAVNADEAEEMVNLARRKELFLMEGMWSVFFPSWIELKASIKQGVIGETKLITVIHGKKSYSLRAKFYDRNLSGGMLSSMGIYGLLLAHVVFGDAEIEKITAVSQNTKAGVDMSSSVSLGYKNGGIVNFITSYEFDHSDGAWIMGEKGSIKLGDPYWCATTLETPDGVYEFPLPKPEGKSNFFNPTGFRYEMNHVRQCIELGKMESPILPHHVSIKLLRQLDEIRRQIGVVYEQDELHR